MSELTKRETISMHMMQALLSGYLSQEEPSGWSTDDIVEYSLELTDALIKANQAAKHSDTADRSV